MGSRIKQSWNCLRIPLAGQTCAKLTKSLASAKRMNVAVTMETTVGDRKWAISGKYASRKKKRQKALKRRMRLIYIVSKMAPSSENALMSYDAHVSDFMFSFGRERKGRRRWCTCWHQFSPWSDKVTAVSLIN